MRRLFNTALAGASMLAVTDLPQGRAEIKPQEVELLEATVPQLQAALTAGTIASRDLVSMYLARIDAYDQRGPALNAISVTNGNALTEADARDAERRAGVSHGPLHGVPVIVKDNYDTADLQTAAGSRSLSGWVPPDDAFLVKKLREAGAIIIAKSNMHEFAYGITTLGSLFGQTRNPYALDRNPGGSSGGTGAAIAANFAAVGIGSDTCGSIRIPASHNSLVGIRGTQGLASRSGIIPLSSTQDIGGPIARTVTDLAIVLDATVGYDPADAQTAASVGNIPKSYTDYLQLTALRGARVGLFPALLERDPADSEVAAVLQGDRRDEGPGCGDRRGLDPQSDRAAQGPGKRVPLDPPGFQIRPERLSGGPSERTGADAGRSASRRQVSSSGRDESAKRSGRRIPGHRGISGAHRQA